MPVSASRSLLWWQATNSPLLFSSQECSRPNKDAVANLVLSLLMSVVQSGNKRVCNCAETGIRAKRSPLLYAFCGWALAITTNFIRFLMSTRWNTTEKKEEDKSGTCKSPLFRGHPLQVRAFGLGGFQGRQLRPQRERGAQTNP